MIIYHHLGLGDHIICNGLVKHIAENKKISLLCKSRNIHNIKFMYSEDTNIDIIEVIDDSNANSYCSPDCLRIGFHSGGVFYQNIGWDEMFYKHANIDFEYSWSKFCCTQNIQEENRLYDLIIKSNTNYAFVHRIGSNNTNGIDDTLIDSSLKIIEPDPNINLFLYRKIIEQAREVHCINSSFIHFTDRIDPIGKLFYHKNFKLKPYSDFTLKHNWNII